MAWVEEQAGDEEAEEHEYGENTGMKKVAFDLRLES